MKRRRILQAASALGLSLAGTLLGEARPNHPSNKGAGSSVNSQMHGYVKARDGTQLFCRSWGRGRPVVFVHGWAVNCDLWQYQMASLAAHVRCVAYDKRGHGRSSDSGRGYDYDTLSDDIAAVIEQLDLREVVLVGHSMGPAEIVRYVSRHAAARVTRLVLISSALPFILRTSDNPNGIDAAVFEERRGQWVQDLPKFLAANARGFLLSETSPETVAWVAAMGAQASLQALLQLNHAITETDLRPEVAAIKMPTLVIHGAQDKSAPLDLTGKRVAAMIQGSELKIYDGAPHGLPVTHQNLLNQDLIHWLQT